MKKAICMGCLPGQSGREKLELAKDAGFDGVEFPGAATEDELTEWKGIADELGLEVPSIMGGLHWQYPLSSADPGARSKCNEMIKHNLREARRIGADTVLLVPGVVNEETTYEEAWERSLAEVRDIGQVAEEEGVVLALENVWNKFLLSPIEFVRFVDEVANPFVKAYFDCGNICFYGYPQHWIRTLGSRIVKMHVKGFSAYPNVGFPKSLESDVPWKECREAWLDIGYDDYLIVEIGPDPEDPQGSIKKYSGQLDRIIEGTL